jgi:guanine deaminase
MITKTNLIFTCCFFGTIKMTLRRMTNDKKFLAKAIEIAGAGIEDGGGPFGAVISKDGKIIAEANNKVVLSSDPTAHAEILVIRDTAKLLKTHDLNGCVLYTSCEPCPMCLGAIYWAGIKRVVYASERYDAAEAGFNDNLIYNEIALDPSERQITFFHLKDSDAKEVFRKWEQFENKISY